MNVGPWYPHELLGGDAGLRAWRVQRENGHRFEKLMQRGRQRECAFASRESAQRKADALNALAAFTESK